MAGCPQCLRAEIERLRALLTEVITDEYNHSLDEGCTYFVERAKAVFGAADETSEPVYRKWPGEPPHCMSCDCGMTEGQKAEAAKTVPLADYLRVHRELMDLKFPGSVPPEKATASPDPREALNPIDVEQQ